MRKTPPPKTNALRILETRGVAFRTVAYEIDDEDLSAAAAAEKSGVPLEKIFKTLVLRGDRTGVFICCVPGGEELDLKSAARVSGNKSCELVPLRELQELTGYVRGGCSPIGTKKPFPVFVDETAILFDDISVSAGERGLQVLLDPKDLFSVTGAVTGPLTSTR
jgi:Cys-tRNA(Pro)/Cys-tRNA(Cys) deacylase